MFNLQLWRGNGKVRRQQDMKARLVKNREPILDIMAEGAKVAKACPFLLGQKCITGLCDLFMEFTNTNLETGEKKPFFNCAIRQLVLTQMETNQRLIEITNLLKEDKNVKVDTG